MLCSSQNPWSHQVARTLERLLIGALLGFPKCSLGHNTHSKKPCLQCGGSEETSELQHLRQAGQGPQPAPPQPGTVHTWEPGQELCCRPRKATKARDKELGASSTFHWLSICVNGSCCFYLSGAGMAQAGEPTLGQCAEQLCVQCPELTKGSGKQP